MAQNRRIVFRATAASGLMTNFLSLVFDSVELCPGAGTPRADLTLSILVASDEEEEKIIETWREFTRCYNRSRIIFLDPEIHPDRDPLAPLGPDD